MGAGKGGGGGGRGWGGGGGSNSLREKHGMVNVNFVLFLSENFSVVSNFFKFGGWRLLF